MTWQKFTQQQNGIKIFKLLNSSFHSIYLKFEFPNQVRFFILSIKNYTLSCILSINYKIFTFQVIIIIFWEIKTICWPQYATRFSCAISFLAVLQYLHILRRVKQYMGILKNPTTLYIKIPKYSGPHLIKCHRIDYIRMHYVYFFFSYLEI